MAKRDTYHHGDLRRALIAAAVELISEGDVKSLSLRQVAKRAGVSHAAPYRHFEDKEALLALVAEEGFLNFTSYLQRAVADWPGDPIRQFQASGLAYLRYAQDHPAHYQVMFSEISTSSSEYAPLIKASNASFQVLVDIIIDGQTQGVFRAADPNLIALCAWTQVHGLAMLLLSGRLGGNAQGEEAIADLSAALCRLLLVGFTTPGESPPAGA